MYHCLQRKEERLIYSIEVEGDYFNACTWMNKDTSAFCVPER